MENNPTKVLLIEDSPDDTILVREMLDTTKNACFDLECFDNLSSGLARMASGGFDVVLCDLSLPDSHGLITFDKVHQRAGKNPVILFTGLSDETVAIEAVKKGAQDYLIKGRADAGLLVRSIRYAIERTGLQKKLDEFHGKEKQRLEELNRKLDAANKEIDGELAIARKVQEGLYPQEIPQMDGLEIAAGIFQARQVGGDYYDIIRINEQEMAFLVVDVAGHDIASAFVVGMAKISFNSHILNHSSLAEIFKHVNDDMVKVIQNNLFLSAFLAVINTHTRTLRYAKAGHFNQILYRARKKEIEILGTDGLLIGCMQDGSFEEKACQIAPDDKLFLYTDGLFENRNPQGEQYGEKRIQGFIKREGRKDVLQLHASILNDQKSFCRGNAQIDDICLVIAELKECAFVPGVKSGLGSELPSFAPVLLHDRNTAKDGIATILARMDEYGFSDDLIRHYRKTLHSISTAFCEQPYAESGTFKAYAKISQADFRIVLMITQQAQEKVDFFTTGPGRNALVHFNRAFGTMEISEPGEKMVFAYTKEKVEDVSEENLSFEIKEDGAYLTVPKSISPLCTIDSVKEDLISDNVVNADFERIQQELQNKSGLPARIGAPFRHYNKEKNRLFLISTTPLEAKLSLIDTDSELRITREDLDFLLLKNRIVFGIQSDILDAIVNLPQSRQENIIACGEPPVPGEAAEIRECIEIDPTLEPLMKDDGSVDHKTLDLLHAIDAGAVIAEKKLATGGIPGTSVFGRTIEPEPGEDKDLPAGENTEISSDGKKLIAIKGGYLFRDIHDIHVRALFRVRGNVDYSTGNIKYAGDVYVTGSVLSGFKVEAGGDIFIRGETEASEIVSKNGNIEFKGGVLGKGNGKITAQKGTITTDFIQDTEIVCSGNLNVKKSILRVTAKVDGDIIVEGKDNGRILGGTIVCRGSVRVSEIGNSQHIKTYIRMEPPKDPALQGKITEALKRKTELETLLTDIQNQLKTRSTLLKLKKEMQQAQKQEVEKLLKKFYLLKEQMENMGNLLAQLKKEEEEQTNYGTITVLQTIYPDVFLSFGKLEKRIISKAGPVRYSWEGDHIKVEPGG